MEKLAAIAPHVDAIIVSDYGHGAVNNKVIEFMKDAAKTTIVVGDSRYSLKKYAGLTMITPNESEAYALAGLPEDAPSKRSGKRSSPG